MCQKAHYIAQRVISSVGLSSGPGISSLSQLAVGEPGQHLPQTGPREREEEERQHTVLLGVG